jgi:methyl-accepting chemotaxis protein
MKNKIFLFFPLLILLLSLGACTEVKETLEESNSNVYNAIETTKNSATDTMKNLQETTEKIDQKIEAINEAAEAVNKVLD